MGTSQVWQFSIVPLGQHGGGPCHEQAFSKKSLLMHLLRALFFIEAHFSIVLKAEHIAGVANSAADNLSRITCVIFCLLLTGRSPPQPSLRWFAPSPAQFPTGLTIPELVQAAQRYILLSL